MKPYEMLKQKLEHIASLPKKPKLLLHSCCGPCSSYVLTFLEPYFDLTVYYYNPNIYPSDEFEKRLENQQKLLDALPFSVELIIERSPYEDYLSVVEAYKTLGEKSRRCYECYKFRMEKLKQVAQKNGFSYFTTTLSVSPHKVSSWINELGESLSEETCQYLYSDFKKENGYLESTKLAKQYHLYRQEYCGCSFSLEETNQRKVEQQKKMG